MIKTIEQEISQINICNVKTRFFLHNRKDKNGLCSIFFSVTISGKRARINTGHKISIDRWNLRRQRTRYDEQLNLLLDNIQAKSTQISTFYYLTNRELCLENFLEEFQNQSSAYNFNEFFLEKIKVHCKEDSTKNKHMAIYNKITDWRPHISFHEINHDWFAEFRAHLRSLGNQSTTENTNVRIVKQYLRMAKKSGIVLNVNLDEVHTGPTTGQREALSVGELKKLRKHYFEGEISESVKLSLGYFLFAYCTGLRLGDLKALKREKLQNVNHFRMGKGKRFIDVQLNNSALALLAEDERLFCVWHAEQTINKHLRNLAAQFNIPKDLSMHVARHTFATHYLKAGGALFNLQKLLGHQKIETTMIYVHLNIEDVVDTFSLIDTI